MLKTTQKNSLWGSGPKLLISTLIYFAIMLYIEKIPLQVAAISEKMSIIYLLSGTLITIGVVLGIFVMCQVFAIYKAGVLYRKGVYAVCRHPLYANFILILVPGICLGFNSWLILTTPVFMYFAFKYFIKEEEQGLIEQFGEDYIQYQKEVNSLVPKI